MFADEIASTSNVMAKELKRKNSNIKKDIYITPFGVDIEKFKKLEVKREGNDFNIGNIKKLEKKIWNRILNTWSRKTNKKTRERRRQ